MAQVVQLLHEAQQLEAGVIQFPPPSAFGWPL